MPSNRRLEVKLPPKLYDEIRGVAQKRGFNSSNSFVRAAIANEMRAGESALDQAEVAIVASIDRLSREIRNLHTAQQAAFAMLACLTRLFLTCVPEPPAEVFPAPKAAEAEIHSVEFGGKAGRISQNGTVTVLYVEEGDTPQKSERSL